MRVEYVMPPVNIYETTQAYILEAEMPGVDKNGLEVTLEGNEITLLGRRRWKKSAVNNYFASAMRRTTAGCLSWIPPSTPQRSRPGSSRDC